jgi:hypothetical protein
LHFNCCLLRKFLHNVCRVVFLNCDERREKRFDSDETRIVDVRHDSALQTNDNRLRLQAFVRLVDDFILDLDRCTLVLLIISAVALVVLFTVSFEEPNKRGVLNLSDDLGH